MLALINEKGSGASLRSIDAPEIRTQEDVKIKIQYCTLCRDDMHVSDSFTLFYGIVGHEAAGIVEEAGAEAELHGFHPGARVVLFPIYSCGKCAYCLSQQPQYCLEAHLMQGVLAEYVVRSYKQLIPLPDRYTFQQGCLLEPVGDVLDAVQRVEPTFSSDVLLFGGGFFGQIMLRVLLSFGVKQVVVVEPLEDRRQLALRYGAAAAFDSDDPDLQVKLLQCTGFRGFSLVIDTSARTDVFDVSLPCIAHGASFLLAAYNDVYAKLSLPVIHMYTGNIKIIWSCFCGMNTMESAMHIIERLRLQDLITVEYPFAKSDQAYRRYLRTDELKIGIAF